MKKILYTINELTNLIVTTVLMGPNKGIRLGKYMQRIPLSRLSSIADVASTAVFLASEALDYITGSTRCADGCMTTL